MSGKKIFITGATGLLGRQVLKSLIDAGYNCIALYRNKIVDGLNVEWIKGDLLQPISYEHKLKGIDTVVHLAAFISYQKKDKDLLINTNFYATRDLVNEALYHQVTAFIYVSSASTLLRSTDPTLVGIGSSGTPVFNSIYAKTKFLGELEVWRAAAEGMKVCILNPALLIGHGPWNNSSMQLFQKIKDGLKYYPPGNLGVTAFDDLANIIVNLCNDGFTSDQYLVNAETWSYKDFLNEIALVLEMPPIKNEAKKWQANIMALKDKCKHLFGGNALITSETIKSSFTKYQYDLNSNPVGYKFQDIRALIHEIVISRQ